MTDAVVACCQLLLRVGDTEFNRAACRDAIVAAAGEGADIVLVPELANSGYVFSDADEARRCAEPADGTAVTEWMSLAREHRLVIVGGLCELDSAMGEARHKQTSTRNDAIEDRRAELYEPVSRRQTADIS